MVNLINIEIIDKYIGGVIYMKIFNYYIIIELSLWFLNIIVISLMLFVLCLF